MNDRRIVVIGASAGGVRALQVLAARIPAGFPSPILVVQHIGSYPSILPALLARGGRLPAKHAEDGDPIVAGRILVAPPDQHMLVDHDVVRLTRGPKEQHARPAIDPLFRSAALSWGPSVVGVLLTGLLDDGTAGLQVIKECGGIAVVQDPDEAENPSMPLSALRHVAVDHTVGMEAMSELLVSIVERPLERVGAYAAPERGMHEHEIVLGKGDFMEHMGAIGNPSTFTCPDCNGSLWEIDRAVPPRFRCHTGHAYTLRSLQHAQSDTADEALWSAFRALHEKELLLRSMAEYNRRVREEPEALRLLDEAEAVSRHGRTLRALIERIPPPPE